MTQQPRIVLVDDDEAARRMMRRWLSRRDYDIAGEADDGASGLALIRSEMPDAVLLDLRMPGELSGIDVARELKSDPVTASVKVIVVSASVHTDARATTKQLGCDGFVEKPVDFDALASVLDALLR